MAPRRFFCGVLTNTAQSLVLFKPGGLSSVHPVLSPGPIVVGHRRTTWIFRVSPLKGAQIQKDEDEHTGDNDHEEDVGGGELTVHCFS